MLIFEVKDGQRKDEIGQAQLAHLRDVGRDLRNEILGQQAGAQDSSDVLRQLFEDTQRLTGGNAAAAAALGFNRPDAVGFRPELTTLPEGASVTGLAIISADRRYVRITPAPFFSQIGDVTTFNFVTGEEGGGAGGGGIGGAAAGGGGLGGQGFN